MATSLRDLLASIQRTMSSWHPLRLLVLGYGSYILVTWIFLCLPPAWNGSAIGSLDNLFTAASAVTTTGLVTVSTPESYSFLGELAILVGIQLGGLGYMTVGSFIMLTMKHDLSSLRANIGGVAFSLPIGFEMKSFLRHVVAFTLLIEAFGAAALYFAFSADGLASPLWPAIFHSVSAFCTAGFSVFPNSLESYRDAFWVNAIISALSILGAVGFLVISDLWMSLTGRRRITLTSRIILHFTALLILAGWAVLFVAEPSFQAMEPGRRLMASGFQAMTAMTTVGFNTHPMGEMSHAMILVMIILMIVGASPSGTGGGVKSTSISAAMAVTMSILRRRDQVTFFGRVVPTYRLHYAFAAIVFYIMAFTMGAILLALVETQLLEDVLFEAASAIGTVGLSRGITPVLTPLGKIIVIVLMFIGRVGPLTLGLAVFVGSDPRPGGEEDLAI